MSQQISTEPFRPQPEMDLRPFMVEGLATIAEGQTDLSLAAKKPASKKSKKGSKSKAGLGFAPPPRNTAWVQQKRPAGASLSLAPPPRGSVWVAQKRRTETA
jgi:hypothetical protein